MVTAVNQTLEPLSPCLVDIQSEVREAFGWSLKADLESAQALVEAASELVASGVLENGVERLRELFSGDRGGQGDRDDQGDRGARLQSWGRLSLSKTFLRCQRIASWSPQMEAWELFQSFQRRREKQRGKIWFSSFLTQMAVRHFKKR
jgi:hypothetical protein